MRGDEVWCQLFSEPDAGSDLAAVRTRAKHVDGGWLVSGQKVWTSGAIGSDYGILLARTGGPGHAGLSVFVVPMNTPGIDIRPLLQMDGESKFNEVYLTDVRLASDAVVGEVGSGWKVATATLGRERLSLGANSVGMFRSLGDLVDAAEERGRLHGSLCDDICDLWVRTWVLKTTWERAIDEGAEPGDASFSVLKLLTSETLKAIGDLGIEALGPDSLQSEAEQPIMRRLLVGHAQTILGGTSEIQRNILAERVLGLPRAKYQDR
ncbi:MAG: acyl-CoA dehydrogenase family protein [Aeromicrobium sp.]